VTLVEVVPELPEGVEANVIVVHDVAVDALYCTVKDLMVLDELIVLSTDQLTVTLP
jgi:hypothetical protein